MFKLIENNWYKRRLPSERKNVRFYDVIGFQKIDGHTCQIYVILEDGSRHRLTGRVTVNKVWTLGKKEPEYGRWTVHGINPYGVHITLEVTE